MNHKFKIKLALCSKQILTYCLSGEVKVLVCTHAVVSYSVRLLQFQTLHIL